MKVNGKKKLHGKEVWNKRLENTSYRTYFEKNIQLFYGCVEYYIYLCTRKPLNFKELTGFF